MWLASAAVIAASVHASFRLGFAADVATLLAVNGPRVLFGAAVGIALALSGALRLAVAAPRPLRELEILAISTGAAGGGFLLVQGHAGSFALALFAAGATAGAFISWMLVRALDRPRRSTNLGVAAALVGMTVVATLAGTYARARRDVVAPAVAWLLGDLAGASVLSGLGVLALAAALLVAALLALRKGARSQLGPLALLASGVGIGAAGPLAFVGGLVPLAVRGLARGASERALLLASAAAGAATVVAVDTVPRLLVGGYAFPWNVPAAMLAVPGFLLWNRARLWREAGSPGPAFEVLELGLIIGLTVAGAWLAGHLASVIGSLT